MNKATDLTMLFIMLATFGCALYSFYLAFCGEFPKATFFLLFATGVDLRYRLRKRGA